MYIETKSSVVDGELVELKKLRIEGTAEELQAFAMAFMDAIEDGKAKRQVNVTKIVVQRI